MNTMRHSLGNPLLVVTLLLLMFTAACGQKGDLYLPDKPPLAQSQQEDEDDTQ